MKRISEINWMKPSSFLFLGEKVYFLDKFGAIASKEVKEFLSDLPSHFRFKIRPEIILGPPFCLLWVRKKKLSKLYEVRDYFYEICQNLRHNEEDCSLVLFDNPLSNTVAFQCFSEEGKNLREKIPQRNFPTIIPMGTWLSEIFSKIEKTKILLVLQDLSFYFDPLNPNIYYFKSFPTQSLLKGKNQEIEEESPIIENSEENPLLECDAEPNDNGSIRDLLTDEIPIPDEDKNYQEILRCFEDIPQDASFDILIDIDKPSGSALFTSNQSKDVSLHPVINYPLQTKTSFHEKRKRLTKISSIVAICMLIANILLFYILFKDKYIGVPSSLSAFFSTEEFDEGVSKRTAYNIMEALIKALPSDCWVTRFEYEQNLHTIELYSMNDQPEAIESRIERKFFSDFNVSLVKNGSEKDEDISFFRYTLHLSPKN